LLGFYPTGYLRSTGVSTKFGLLALIIRDAVWFLIFGFGFWIFAGIRVDVSVY